MKLLSELRALIAGAHDSAVKKALRALAEPVVGTATAATGAATLNAMQGVVTSEALTTAQNAIYTLTLTNSEIGASDVVVWSVGNGTNTQGTPMPGLATVAAGSVVFKVINKHATSEALNGTIKVAFRVIKAGAGV